MAPHVLIIGYGNSLRQDDGVGPLIAEKLQSSLSDLHPRVVGVHQLNPELAEECARCSLAVFIDACENGIPGEISFVGLDGSSEKSSSLNHFLDAHQLLAWSKEWYGKAPAAALITITGASFSYSTELSTELAAALPAIMERVEKLVRSWLPAAPQSSLANSH